MIICLSSHISDMWLVFCTALHHKGIAKMQIELESLETRLIAISNRIRAILESSPNIARLYAERMMLDIPDDQDKVTEKGSKSVQKVIESSNTLGLQQVLFLHVESDYYSWPLWKRSIRLGAPGEQHLCKSIVFENTRFDESKHEGMYVKYWCVIVQVNLYDHDVTLVL